MARIQINDLPISQDIAPEEMEAIVGAGLRPVRLGVELLETRELMASGLTASLSSGLLRIEGTDRADQIRVVQSGDQIKIDGLAIQTATGSQSGVSVSSVSRVEVLGLAGDDAIWIGNLTQARVDVSAGVGSDLISLANTSTSAGGETGDRIEAGGWRYELGTDGYLRQQPITGGTWSLTDQRQVQSFAVAGDKLLVHAADGYLRQRSVGGGSWSFANLEGSAYGKVQSFAVQRDHLVYLQIDGHLGVRNWKTGGLTVSRGDDPKTGGVREFAVAGGKVYMWFADGFLRQQNLDGSGWDFGNREADRTYDKVTRAERQGDSLVYLEVDGSLRVRDLTSDKITVSRGDDSKTGGVREFAVAGGKVYMWFADGFLRQQNLDGSGWDFGNREADRTYDKVIRAERSEDKLHFLESDGDLKQLTLSTGKTTTVAYFVNTFTVNAAGVAVPTTNSVGRKWLSMRSELGGYLNKMESLGGGVEVYHFANGAIFHLSSSRNYAVTGRVWEKYQALSEQGVDVGLPKGNAYAVSNGVHSGTAVEFERGFIFYLGSPKRVYALTSAENYRIWEKYRDLRNAGTDLGAPKGNAYAVTGGSAMEFANGAIFYLGSKARTYVIGDAALMKRYLELGGASGSLGVPTSNGIDFGGGWWGHTFTGGAIFVKGSETRVVSGAIWDRYQMLGGTTGSLGKPLGNASSVNGSMVQFFEHGAIYWTSSLGAVATVVTPKPAGSWVPVGGEKTYAPFQVIIDPDAMLPNRSDSPMVFVPALDANAVLIAGSENRSAVIAVIGLDIPSGVAGTGGTTRVNTGTDADTATQVIEAIVEIGKTLGPGYSAPFSEAGIL